VPRPPGPEAADLAGVTIRPIAPADHGRLTRFHSELSPETTRMRFFGYHPELSARELKRFTNVDHVDREALVALADDEVIGVTRFDRLPGTTSAEIAFVVSDRWQHHGLGRDLLHAIARRASAEGIDTLVAETLLENGSMIALFEHSGWCSEHTGERGVALYELKIRTGQPAGLTSW